MYKVYSLTKPYIYIYIYIYLYIDSGSLYRFNRFRYIPQLSHIGLPGNILQILTTSSRNIGRPVTVAMKKPKALRTQNHFELSNRELLIWFGPSTRAQGSEVSCFKVLGPKDHTVQGFWAVLSLRGRVAPPCEYCCKQDCKPWGP